MADDGASRGKEDGKLFSRSKWRGKIFAKEDSSKSPKSPTQTDDDIMKFLHSSRPTPAATLPPIDVANAPRYPGAAEGTQASSSTTASRPTTGHPISPNLSPRKIKKNKGLTVKFATSVPLVIGHGGDECEEPTTEISKSRGTRSASSIPQDGSSGHGLSLQQDDFKPRPFRRQPTGLRQSAGSYRQDPSNDSHGSDETHTPNVPGPTAKSPMSLSNFAARVQAKQAEEAQAFHKPPRSPSPTVDGQPKAIESGEAPPDYYLGQSEPHQPQDFAPSPSYSLRPTPSPQPSHLNLPPSAHHPAYQEKAPPVPPAHAELPQTHPAPATQPQKSVYSVVTAIGDQALEDFSRRVEPYNSIFHLSAESVKPVAETPFVDWIRSATWWFLKGRYELETAMRTRHSDSGPRVPAQAHIDLAKAWWVIQQVTVQHPEPHRYGNGPISELGEMARRSGDQQMADCIDIHQAIVSNLRALTMSMKRNNVLPDPQNAAQLDSRLETSIWIKYPFFTPEVCSVLSSTTSKSLVLQAPRNDTAIRDTLPIGDSKKDFNYGRFFVDVFLSDSSDEGAEFQLPCVLSVLRDRTDWQIRVVIASQSDLVNIRIEPTSTSATSWENVRWRARQFCLLIDLQRHISLTIQLSQRDFATLWNIYDHSNKIEDSLSPEPGENLIFESTVRSFQLTESDPSSKSFPKEPVQRCRIRLFERKATISEGTGARKAHRDFRMLVISSPKAKVMSRISEKLGGQTCMQYGLLRGADGDAALLLKTGKEQNTKTMIFSFQNELERAHVFSLLSASAPADEEMLYADLPLQKLSIEPHSQSEAFIQSGHDLFKDLHWERLLVINKDPENPEHDYGQTLLSQNLRIVSEAQCGAVTDRINVGPGQIMIRLEVSNAPELRFYRLPQEDLTVSVTENQVPKTRASDLSTLLGVVSKTESIHTYTFHNLKDLHTFQAASTGFEVLFDGLASSFAIARRRMIVPVYKKWDSNFSRIQILRQERVVQLVAFFSEFSHGHCMNFVLKGTDVFESFNKSGKYGIRVVDAKFSLPKDDKDQSSHYVSLDLPEYPSEHDDITISFDSQVDRDKFQTALPAAAVPVSRMPSLRK